MKRLFLLITMASAALMAEAGGLMTNTNYHIAFDRMFARGATLEIDGAYSNPAGLVWGHEGLQLSLNFQKPWQNRDIETDIPSFMGSNFHQKYNGKASAPIVPALFASYVKDRWAVSTMIGIVGSGGFVKYDEGVPMFTVPVTAMLGQSGQTPDKYVMDAQMKGKQYIYGAQVSFAYKITDFLSAAVGMRANYYDGYYKGHVTATLKQPELQLVGLQLDCVQKGWGFNPILSLDYHQERLTLAARYEFRAKINVPNDTKTLDAAISGKTPAEVQAAFGSKIAAYQDGVKTRYDMPSLLVLAAGYEFTTKLRAALEYHFFDDKNAKMAGNRQDELKHGTHEVLLGAEYDINDKFTVSCGGQRTDYGLSDTYQANTSFACDSYSVGLGGAVNLTEKIRLNVSYFCSIYSKYKVENANYLGLPFAGSDTYSRTNHVIGLGLDYKF